MLVMELEHICTDKNQRYEPEACDYAKEIQLTIFRLLSLLITARQRVSHD